MTWRDDAACRSVDPEAFFLGNSRGEAFLEVLAVCNSCPVQAECRDYALSDPTLAWDGTGIWAGLTAHERQVILRQRNERRSVGREVAA